MRTWWQRQGLSYRRSVEVRVGKERKVEGKVGGGRGMRSAHVHVCFSESK